MSSFKTLLADQGKPELMAALDQMVKLGHISINDLINLHAHQKSLGLKSSDLISDKDIKRLSKETTNPDLAEQLFVKYWDIQRDPSIYLSMFLLLIYFFAGEERVKQLNSEK